jgi:predicted aminopeptidase
VNSKSVLRTIVLLGLCFLQSACYYVQATRGQIEVLTKREPIDEILASPDTTEELGRRLRLVQDARRFSVDELALPDNKSYRSYSDLERDFVVWNVFAAPEFSLDAREWCYPIVGCVSYRGYFSEEAAYREADTLSGKGFDVAVGGVPAYSTLGNFNDPVLNTMMRWDDVKLVSTLFHELAHQVLYIKDDTAFNESFATAVEEIGIERWLAAKGRQDDMANYRAQKALHRRLVELVSAAKVDLAGYYAGDVGADVMRQLKSARLEQLSSDVRVELRAAGRSENHWLTGDLNNARLLPMSLYDAQVPAFLALYDDCGSELECLYDEAGKIAKLDPVARQERLDALAARQAAKTRGD